LFSFTKIELIILVSEINGDEILCVTLTAYLCNLRKALQPLGEKNIKTLSILIYF
jgi:hypothetical protein